MPFSEQQQQPNLSNIHSLYQNVTHGHRKWLWLNVEYGKMNIVHRMFLC